LWVLFEKTKVKFGVVGSRLENLLQVDFQDLAAAKHANEEIVEMINRHASCEDFLDLSLAGEVNDDFLVGCKKVRNVLSCI